MSSIEPLAPEPVEVSLRRTSKEHEARRQLAEAFSQRNTTLMEKLEAFPCFVPRQIISRFLALYEIFKIIEEVHGDVIDCGVFWGFSLFSFAHFSVILEPYNFQRRIVGFDTFAGFPDIHEHDRRTTGAPSIVAPGGYRADSFESIQQCIAAFDNNRYISHIPKMLLVPGDARVTIPKYMEEHPHTVVALLHLDFDLYEPTRVALRHFLPRMPKGAVLFFDELHHPDYPGETLAVAEEVGVEKLRIRRLRFQPHFSYAVVGD